uniref:Xylanolytic transcriptional activator regulatory domain-containing protein n=1 Tax=Mycena chlorophos TaxID=658473 RepID=A0ABQ0L2H4_MYCCL|nr:predicted protein [Mycena chlorophos]
MPGNRCSNCISFNLECIHDTPRIGPTRKDESAAAEASTSSTATKTAQEHVASILVQATSYIKDDDVRRVLLDVARYARTLENRIEDHERPSRSPSSSHDSGSSPTASSSRPPTSPPQLVIKEEEDNLYIDGLLSDRFDRFRLESDATRYYGKSSHFELINTAIDIRENTTEPAMSSHQKRDEFWLSQWEHDHLSKEDPPIPHAFPEPDLLDLLVRTFFERVNIVITLLHRPSFERNLAAGLHYSEPHFGELVLGVCAVAAKFTDDPRVILPGTNSRLSSGWQYYQQIRPYQKSLIRSITLFEAQTLCLCVIYIQGGSTPDMCWGLGGAGVRYAQEVGVHRKGRYENDPVLAEQWKRVFWMLVCIDTLVSSFVGRPRATKSSDYDLDYPADCDDEYWETEDPEHAFKQPPGRPSYPAAMIAYLKLMEILGMAQETIYLVNAKDKSVEWLQEAVANVDSALNDWADKIPDHLRWDPNREDPVFATQSAVLYAAYYHVQIQVHRIFIIAPRSSGIKYSPNPEWREAQIGTSLAYNYPSLAICASSARACSHVMDVASRKGLLCNPHVINAVFDSGIILLLNVWGGRKVGLNVDPKKCLQDIDICLRVFRVYETRWQVAGRQHDIIMELMSAANMDIYAIPSLPNTLKRVRDVDVDAEREQLEQQEQAERQREAEPQQEREPEPASSPSVSASAISASTSDSSPSPSMSTVSAPASALAPTPPAFAETHPVAIAEPVQQYADHDETPQHEHVHAQYPSPTQYHSPDGYQQHHAQQQHSPQSQSQYHHHRYAQQLQAQTIEDPDALLFDEYGQLPMSSHDLGRMPLYEPFHVSWDADVGMTDMWAKHSQQQEQAQQEQPERLQVPQHVSPQHIQQQSPPHAPQQVHRPQQQQQTTYTLTAPLPNHQQLPHHSPPPLPQQQQHPTQMPVYSSGPSYMPHPHQHQQDDLTNGHALPQQVVQPQQQQHPNPAMYNEGLELPNGVPTAGYDWDQWGKYINSIEEFMTALDGPATLTPTALAPVASTASMVASLPNPMPTYRTHAQMYGHGQQGQGLYYANGHNGRDGQQQQQQHYALAGARS